MSNLLQIEADFLRSAEVRSHVRLDRIEQLQSAVTDAKKVKFEKSLKLAEIVKTSHEWFTSEEGKRQMQEEGITWNSEDFANKVFGWQKSYFFKMVKVGNLKAEHPNVVSKYKRETTQAENNGVDVPRSVGALLKFAKAELSEDTSESGAVQPLQTKLLNISLFSNTANEHSLKITGDRSHLNRHLIEMLIEHLTDANVQAI